MYWIVLATTNQYRIYNYQKEGHQLTLFKEESHPESKAKISDLVTDKQGHYKAGASHGAYSPHTSPQEDEIDRFLRTLAEECKAGKANNQYENIILIAPPKVDGILAKHFDKHVKNQVISNLKKDYIHFSTEELNQFLRDNWLELVNH